MSEDVHYSAGAFWGSRREGPESIAERWIKLITRLQALDPVFADWYYWPNTGPSIAFRPDKEQIAAFVESKVGTNDDGSPEPLYGYYGFMRNVPAGDGPRAFTIDISAGTGGPYCFNNVLISTASHIPADPDVITFRVFKGLVLALAEAFKPDCINAYPSSVLDFWPRRKTSAPAMKLGWINYIAPSYTHLITPPASAIVDYQPDGGLLMAATDETFDIKNPQHMALARNIEAASAPFNAAFEQEWADIIAKGYR